MKGMRKCSLVVRAKELFLLTLPFILTTKSKSSQGHIGKTRRDTVTGLQPGDPQRSVWITWGRGRATGGVFFREGAGTGCIHPTWRPQVAFC